MTEVSQNTQLVLPVGEDVELRQLVEADAELLHATIQGCKDHLSKFDNPTPHRYESVQTAEAQIRGQDENFKVLGMWSGQLLVGAVSYRTERQTLESSSAEIGYWVAEEHTGHGYAHRSAEVLTDHLLGQPEIHSVGAYIRVGNVPSAGTAQKAGLKYLGALLGDIDGDFWLFGKYKTVPAELDGFFADEILEVRTLRELPSRTIAWIRLDGVNRPVVNHGCDTTYEVFQGEATFIVDGEPNHLTEGLKVTIPKGTPYQDIGNAVMYATSVPPFDPSKVEFLR